MNQTHIQVTDTETSRVIEYCQVCGYRQLDSILFLGYLPPVNAMSPIGEQPHEQSSYPAELLYCPNCHLAQLGCIVDSKVIFPSSYPYTSSTTKILRDNFTELYQESQSVLNLGRDDLVIDIGSNDGNLLVNFKDRHRVLGITPEDIGKLAIERGIPTILDYFGKDVVSKILTQYGKAKMVTATNVFAHLDHVNVITECILQLLAQDGVFISESHYFPALIETLQYDTIYHEHLRYYSLHSLKYLFEKHDLEIIHAKRIPTHGGSVRVYAARRGVYAVRESVNSALRDEKTTVLQKESLRAFKTHVVMSKLELQTLIHDIKKRKNRIYGISAPSRASTLINYVGIDDGILDCVLEIQGSYKIGHYVPGTLIPVVEENRLFEDPPDYALILSWHIAQELTSNLKKKGFKGDFIVPLPKPRILKNEEVK